MPLLTSTPHGMVAATASWTLPGESPPDSSSGLVSARGRADQSKARPLPPSWPPPWLSNRNADAPGKAATRAGPPTVTPAPMPTALRYGSPKRRQKASSSSPWNCSMLGRTCFTTSRTSSAGLSRNTATASTSGASASRRARASATWSLRVLPRAKTKPMASTPSPLARRTSPARVRPQNLMRVRKRVRGMSGSWQRKGSGRGAGGLQRDFRREAAICRIEGPEEDQAPRRRGRAGAPAVARVQHFRDPLLRTAAAAHFQQRSDDVADHMMQEGVGLDVDHHHVTLARHADPLQVAAGVWRLAVHGPERSEVELADQGLGGAMHGIGVQRMPAPG